jgi:hypothetical protein
MQLQRHPKCSYMMLLQSLPSRECPLLIGRKNQALGQPKAPEALEAPAARPRAAAGGGGAHTGRRSRRRSKKAHASFTVQSAVQPSAAAVLGARRALPSAWPRAVAGGGAARARPGRRTGARRRAPRRSRAPSRPRGGPSRGPAAPGMYQRWKKGQGAERHGLGPATNLHSTPAGTAPAAPSTCHGNACHSARHMLHTSTVPCHPIRPASSLPAQQ